LSYSLVQGYAPAPGRKLALPMPLVSAPLLAAWLGLAALKLAMQKK
jgi:hypothetical protein